jgi:anti-sigma factor RsiW
MSAAPACREPIGVDTLVEYWLGELDDERTQRVDEHLLGCEDCGARLDEIVAMADGVRRAFDGGLIGTVVGAKFAQRLAERGLRLREYRVERNGSVNCSVAADDDVVISRLSAPLAGVGRVDVVRQSPGEPAVRADDIPFDAASGVVIVVVPAARLRELPTCVETLQLYAVEARGERLLGHYTFNHRSSR